MISDVSTIRFNSLMSWAPMYTGGRKGQGHVGMTHPQCEEYRSGEALTLLLDETVISVVGVVGVAEAALRVLELEELVPVLTHVARAGEQRKSQSCTTHRGAGPSGEGEETGELVSGRSSARRRRGARRPSARTYGGVDVRRRVST